MFSSYCSEDCSFQSTWKKTFKTAEVQLQTDTYKIVHRGLNVKKHNTKECQTDAYLFVEEEIRADVDDSDLKDFIRKTVPIILKTLNNNERSVLFNIVRDEIIDKKDCVCLYFIPNKAGLSAAKCITQITWNCNGTVLAVGYGDIDHNNWCTHTNTGIGIFSLSLRKKPEFEDKPDSFLETTTCVTTVQFHNSVPSLIAAGTHNGELTVWDRSKSENDLSIGAVANSKLHEDSINAVFWLNGSKAGTLASNHKLITLSSDGTIKLWNLSMRKFKISLLSSYSITAQDLPKSIRYRGNRSKTLCLLSGCLSPTDDECLVAGTDVGTIFVCRIKCNDDTAPLPDSESVNSPVEFVLGTVPGVIHTLEWSRIVTNFLVAASSNGMIFIYNIESKQQILTADPGQGYLYDLSISSLMHGVIATAGENGKVVLTDILQQNISASDGMVDSDIVANTSVVVLKHQLDDGKISSMNCVQFNNATANLLAASDSNGSVYFWELSPQITEKTMKSRQAVLENLLGTLEKR